MRSNTSLQPNNITRALFLASLFISQAILLLIPAGEARATEALSGREIMYRVNTADMGDRVSQTIHMTLIDKRGREKQQTARSFRKRTGDGPLKETRSIMFFISPEKMLNTAFLSVDFDDPEREDKQWIYLPISKQTKRIAGNDKRLSFMGSDFSHADMAMRNIHNYQYNILGEEVINGHKAWVIESIPLNATAIDEDGYVKSLVHVRQDNFMVVRSLNTLKQGGRTKQMEVIKLEQIDGIWVQTEVVMSTMKADTLLSKTVMKTEDVKFHKKLKDEIFTVRAMESGLESIE